MYYSINSNVEVLKRDYAAQANEIARRDSNTILYSKTLRDVRVTTSAH